MFRKLIIAAGMALAVSGLAAGAADALEASCLWNNLAPAKQAELLENYRKTGLESLNSLPLVDEDLTGWSERCAVTMDNAETAGALLGTVVMEKGIAASLAKDYGVKPEALAAAWRRVTPQALVSLRAGVIESFGEGEVTRADADVEQQMMAELKLPDEAFAQVNLYAFALMARELKSGR